MQPCQEGSGAVAFTRAEKAGALWSLQMTEFEVQELILFWFGFILLWMSCSLLSGRNPENITAATPTSSKSFCLGVERPPG